MISGGILSVRIASFITLEITICAFTSPYYMASNASTIDIINASTLHK